jgi:3-deoxy-manno-octulosonate cytidylyltransferase (CMP-KDO synthetase)
VLTADGTVLTSFKVYVPARYAAERLPGKLLLDLAGRPLIHRTCAAALAAGPEQVVLATDDARIAQAVADLDVQVCMTSGALGSGTDRIAEAARLRGEPDDTLIVNLQGDEPMTAPDIIRQVAGALVAEPGAAIATICAPLANGSDVFDPNVVKVVRDARGRALYFSRAPLPWDRARFAEHLAPEAGAEYRRHVGVYAYRAGYVRRFVRYPPAPIENIERLEQLRALYHGDVIVAPDAVCAAGVGIDTGEDLQRARAAFTVWERTCARTGASTAAVRE